MTACRSCGTAITWRVNPKTGKGAWYDVDPVIHFRTCKKRRKPKLAEWQTQAIAGILAYWKTTEAEARDFVLHCSAKDAEGAFREYLAQQAEKAPG